MRLNELAQIIKQIVERVRPDLSTYMRFPVQGKVTAIDLESYSCDVQPLDENMSLLPACKVLTPWATKTTRLVILPAVDDLVMVGFENGDHDKSYIEGFLTDQGPDGYLLLESEKARIVIDGDGKIQIESDDDVEVSCTNAKINASGTIELGEEGSGVVTNVGMPVCFVTGAPIPCSATVSAKM